MERWSPLDIEVMLHHHCGPSPWPQSTAPAYYDTVKDLYESGLLYQDDKEIWRSTALGAAFVRAICGTPIPKQVFMDPRTKEILGDGSGQNLQPVESK